ncbi:MAG: hypothetical protein R2838_21125 [Caldilineaceae bacterium]
MTISSDPLGVQRQSTDELHGGRILPVAGAVGPAAIGDEAVTEEFSPTWRARSMWPRAFAALHPMADLATEPRWARQRHLRRGCRVECAHDGCIHPASKARRWVRRAWPA